MDVGVTTVFNAENAIGSSSQLVNLCFQLLVSFQGIQFLKVFTSHQIEVFTGEAGNAGLDQAITEESGAASLRHPDAVGFMYFQSSACLGMGNDLTKS